MQKQEEQVSNHHQKNSDKDNNGRTISEYREIYESYSGDLSIIVRNLALAGIGLVWVFTKGNSAIPDKLIVPSIFLIFCLTFDLLQYLYGTVVWHYHFRKNEKKDLPEDTKFEHSVHWNDASWALWVLKILCVLVAYGIIIDFLINTLIVRK